MPWPLRCVCRCGGRARVADRRRLRSVAWASGAPSSRLGKLSRVSCVGGLTCRLGGCIVPSMNATTTSSNVIDLLAEAGMAPTDSYDAEWAEFAECQVAPVWMQQRYCAALPVVLDDGGDGWLVANWGDDEVVVQVINLVGVIFAEQRFSMCDESSVDRYTAAAISSVLNAWGSM